MNEKNLLQELIQSQKEYIKLLDGNINTEKRRKNTITSYMYSPEYIEALEQKKEQAVKILEKATEAILNI